ncbi:hypothetical protein PAECIP111802_06949 [Paenibacillus allorhizosphaerae]|uniref:Uncharacterized protein n=1 Tax=Paenibacillus allorhizosphaerae TaxID=2849866 RepID=A0ABM8VTR3_9BACL|nr:hypothetical protein PAECIP111802_06949 [Paenibacillus allorhizosphaerae]
MPCIFCNFRMPPKVSSEVCSPVQTHPSEVFFFLQIESVTTYRNVKGER